MKFKVGDRVRAIREHDMNERIVGKTGRVVSERDEDNEVGVAFDDYINGHCCDGSVIDGYGWYVGVDALELVKDDETIVIYRKGDEVVALDKRTGKKAVAKCSPDDTFDFNVGAKLAFERLTNNVTFRLLCIEDSILAEKGKVYEFIDGVTTWRDGTHSNEYDDINDFKRKNSVSYDEHFVELKDGDDPAEILKKYDREIRVGDTVKVMDTGRVYTTATLYFEDHNVPTELMCKWDYGTSLTVLFGGHTSNEVFTVKFVADNRCIIERRNGRCYLIACGGVKKC